jgi:hypothetical protein
MPRQPSTSLTGATPARGGTALLLDRYFYFEDVRDQGSLFRHVVRAILAIEPAAPIS